MQRVELGVGDVARSARRPARQRRAARRRPASTSRWPVPRRAARPRTSRSRFFFARRSPTASRYGSPAGGGRVADRQRRRVGHDAHLRRGRRRSARTTSSRGELRDADHALGRARRPRRERSGTSRRVRAREVVREAPRRRGRGPSRRRGTAGAAAGSSSARGRASAPRAAQRARQPDLLPQHLGPAPPSGQRGDVDVRAAERVERARARSGPSRAARRRRRRVRR